MYLCVCFVHSRLVASFTIFASSRERTRKSRHDVIANNENMLAEFPSRSFPSAAEARKKRARARCNPGLTTEQQRRECVRFMKRFGNVIAPAVVARVVSLKFQTITPFSRARVAFVNLFARSLRRSPSLHPATVRDRTVTLDGAKKCARPIDLFIVERARH